MNTREHYTQNILILCWFACVHAYCLGLHMRISHSSLHSCGQSVWAKHFSLQLSLSPSSVSVCCSLRLFPLSVSIVWAPSQVECVFLNEYLMRLMRLAGGGAVSVEYWERKKQEQGGGEGGRWRGKGREAETLTHTESRRQKSNQAERGREGAGGLVALHNTHWSNLARRSWWCLQHWGTSFHHGL